MMDKETKDYVRQNMDKSANSSRTVMMEIMESFKEEIISAIENKLETKIETKVNGEIKKIQKTLEAQNVVQAEQSRKIDELKPLLEKSRDIEATKRTLGSYAGIIKLFASGFLLLAALIGAWYVIRDFIHFK